MRKITLKIGAEPTWKAIGISSPERDYRLCYLINKSLGMEFSKGSSLFIFLGEAEGRAEALAFQTKALEGDGFFYLLKNRQENFYIIPKWKKADYVLLATEEVTDEEIKRLVQALSSVQNIHSTFAIPTGQTLHIDVE